MNYLSYNDIISEAVKCVNGRIIRVGYTTEAPLIKAYTEGGYRVFKLVETSTRLGVNYSNIKAVIEKRQAQTASVKQRANNYTWVIENKVCYNSNTQKTYLRMTSLNGGHNTKVQYLVYDPELQLWDTLNRVELIAKYRHLFKDGYFEKSSGDHIVCNIPFEHIYRIGNCQA